MRYGNGCVPAARSWKSVRFPPNEFVEITCWDLKRVSQMGQRSSISCSVVIAESPASQASRSPEDLKGKKRATCGRYLRLTRPAWRRPAEAELECGIGAAPRGRRRRIVRDLSC
jgi:hypothetical protein